MGTMHSVCPLCCSFRVVPEEGLGSIGYKDPKPGNPMLSKDTPAAQAGQGHGIRFSAATLAVNGTFQMGICMISGWDGVSFGEGA